MTFPDASCGGKLARGEFHIQQPQSMLFRITQRAAGQVFTFPYMLETRKEQGASRYVNCVAFRR